MKIKLKNLSLIFIMLSLATSVSGQCPVMDATFTVSDITIEVGETLIVTYTGVSEDCAECVGLLSFGELGEPVQERSEFSTGEIIGKYIYNEAGTYDVDFEITNEEPCDDDGDESSITVTVVNPSGCPLAFFTGRPPVCLEDVPTAYSYEITTTSLGIYSVEDVNWLADDGGEIINTGTSLILSHTYDSPGAYYMSANVEFITGGGDRCIQEVFYIDNGYSLETFGGIYPYLNSNIFGGIGEFEILPYLYGEYDNLIQFKYLGGLFDPFDVYDPEYFIDFPWIESFDVVGDLEDPVIGPFSVDDIIFSMENIGPGTYSATISRGVVGTCYSSKTLNFVIPANVVDPCDSCNSFRPDIGERYWMSAWVHVAEEDQVKTFNPENYASGEAVDPEEVEDAFVEFYFVGPNTSTYFFPTGDIIDGWQRIVGEFTIPDMTTDFEVKFGADKDDLTYFDDIRIHPFNGSMKSYVYDKETFWLLSELDDNNYATFYEYDQEGGLIRIKKETSKGIVTIQETRSGTIKKD